MTIETMEIVLDAMAMRVQELEIQNAALKHIIDELEKQQED